MVHGFTHAAPTSAVTVAAVALASALALQPGVRAQSLPVTSITVDASASSSATQNRVYDGAGAELGGGGNAHYLMDYPEPERS